jgi:hypothetical membrane protein
VYGRAAPLHELVGFGDPVEREACGDPREASGPQAGCDVSQCHTLGCSGQVLRANKAQHGVFVPQRPEMQRGFGVAVTGACRDYAAFMPSGMLLIIGVLGIVTSRERDGTRPVARWTSTVLLALSGVGLVLAGLFTPAAPIPHVIGFLLAVGVPILSFLAAGTVLRGIPRRRRFGSWLRLGSTLTVVLLILSQVTFNQLAIVAGQGIAGLTSRLLAVAVLAWFAVMGWMAFLCP